MSLTCLNLSQNGLPNLINIISLTFNNMSEILVHMLMSQLLFCTRDNMSSRSSKPMSGSNTNGEGRVIGFHEERIFDSISGSISTAPVCRSDKQSTSTTATRGQRANEPKNVPNYSTSVTYESEGRINDAATRISTASAVSQAITRMRGEIGTNRQIKQVDKGYFSTTRSRDEISLQGVCRNVLHEINNNNRYFGK